MFSSAQTMFSSAQKNDAMAATIMWRIEIIKIMSKSETGQNFV